jgi:hypothetical protein
MAPGLAAVTENCGDASALEIEKEATAPSSEAATSRFRFMGCNRRRLAIYSQSQYSKDKCGQGINNKS